MRRNRNATAPASHDAEAHMAKATCKEQTAEPNRKANSQGAKGAPPAHEPSTPAPQGTERSKARHDAAGQRAQGNPNTRPESLGDLATGETAATKTRPRTNPTQPSPKA